MKGSEPVPESKRKPEFLTSRIKRIIAEFLARYSLKKPLKKAIASQKDEEFPAYRGMSRSDRAMVLLISIPPEIAVKIFKGLSQESVQYASVCISRLPKLTPEMKNEAINEFTRDFNLRAGLLEDIIWSSQPLADEDIKKIALLIENLLVFEKATQHEPVILDMIHGSKPVSHDDNEDLAAKAGLTSTEIAETIKGSAPLQHNGTDAIKEKDREIAAAMIFTAQGAFPKWYKERILQFLGQEEIDAIGRGLGIMNSSRLICRNDLWERVERHFTGDWWEERDVAELIRCVLKNGFQEKIKHRWSFKLSALLLSLSSEAYKKVHIHISSMLPPHSRIDLMTELSSLMFKLNHGTRISILKDFLRFYQSTCEKAYISWDNDFMKGFIRRIYEEDPDTLAKVIKKITQRNMEHTLQLVMLSLEEPELTADLFLRYCLKEHRNTSPKVGEIVKWLKDCLDVEKPECKGLPQFALQDERRIFTEFFSVFYSIAPEKANALMIKSN